VRGKVESNAFLNRRNEELQICTVRTGNGWATAKGMFAREEVKKLWLVGEITG
jgi:hypothetical protein